MGCIVLSALVGWIVSYRLDCITRSYCIDCIGLYRIVLYQLEQEKSAFMYWLVTAWMGWMDWMRHWWDGDGTDGR